MRDDLGPVVSLPESASVLNVVLHVVYDVSCAHYHPGIDTLIAAVEAMAKYGLPPRRHIAPSTPLYSLILGQAPVQPIITYALAATHDLYDLAVPISSHLLSFALHTLTDELAIRIGPVYMKRLFFLHLGRLDALKRLLLPPPHPHPPTSNCDFTEQKKLTRAWALASAYLAWDARPGTHIVGLRCCTLMLNDDASKRAYNASSCCVLLRVARFRFNGSPRCRPVNERDGKRVIAACRPPLLRRVQTEPQRPRQAVDHTMVRGQGLRYTFPSHRISLTWDVPLSYHAGAEVDMTCRMLPRSVGVAGGPGGTMRFCRKYAFRLRSPPYYTN